MSSSLLKIACPLTPPAFQVCFVLHNLFQATKVIRSRLTLRNSRPVCLIQRCVRPDCLLFGPQHFSKKEFKDILSYPRMQHWGSLASDVYVKFMQFHKFSSEGSSCSSSTSQNKPARKRRKGILRLVNLTTCLFPYIFPLHHLAEEQATSTAEVEKYVFGTEGFIDHHRTAQTQLLEPWFGELSSSSSLVGAVHYSVFQ